MGNIEESQMYWGDSIYYDEDTTVWETNYYKVIYDKRGIPDFVDYHNRDPNSHFTPNIYLVVFDKTSKTFICTLRIDINIIPSNNCIIGARIVYFMNQNITTPGSNGSSILDPHFLDIILNCLEFYSYKYCPKKPVIITDFFNIGLAVENDTKFMQWLLINFKNIKSNTEIKRFNHESDFNNLQQKLNVVTEKTKLIPTYLRINYNPLNVNKNYIFIVYNKKLDKSFGKKKKDNYGEVKTMNFN